MFSFAIHVCSVLLALSRLVHGLPKILEDPEAAGPPSGYSIVPIEWDVPIDLNTPGSATVHLSGTIQDVVEQHCGWCLGDLQPMPMARYRHVWWDHLLQG
ncbi:uncharacterized protein PODANS_4_515 [Podospora anserina S mat+]|uniref:Podospora anserina S mat+ genomic DNA chromosome 4, supercontig 1 n=1 Tax=Podospora anserina (strain S / ATCC MYA-4624 / DSM 980 / FGSC 10383) TaxID=515849 RepID=B2ADA0_PODAN|nr:uncharacterized protein PODANS_4_515 [Podospora anserina S mat+]CAP61415.1 unnamed protein product [Podospora anserina S mat+]CDP27770.1 Putative protein of unknown function [Podospora anserina S mat+]